jgi:hypothetical protein
MITSLAEFYRAAAIAPITQEMLEKREKSITTLIGRKRIDWLLDCIRLYLQKPMNNELFRGEFIKAFQDEDPLFKNSDNQLEITVLAGAIISEYLKRKREKNDDRVSVALALVCAKFSIITTSQVNYNVIQQAIDYLNQEGKNKRIVKDVRAVAPEDFSLYPTTAAADIAKIDTFLKIFNANFSTHLKKLEANDQSLKRKIFILEEESDIHWWLFRSFSSKLNKPIKEVDPKIAIFICAWELWKLTRITPPPTNYHEFLKKTIDNVAFTNDSPFSITQVIDSLNTAQIFKKRELEEKPYQNYGSLTPLLFALQKAEESGGDPGWTAAFKVATSCNPDSNHSAMEFASQFYLELLLTKTVVE